MQSLYYLSHGAGLNRFRDVFEEEELLATTFDTEKLHSLTAFIKQERAIEQQAYLIIDVGDMRRWSVGHVLSAVQYLRRFSKTRLIFIGEPASGDVEELFNALSSRFHIDDLILAAPEDNADQDLRDCFALGDLPRNDRLRIAEDVLLHSAQKPTPQLIVPDGFVVRVAVIGAMPRCGTTTQAFGVYHYLERLGLRPALIDKTGNTLDRLEQVETITRDAEGVALVRNVRFVERELAGCDAYVIDCGVISAERSALLSEADASLLVSGAKPWEMEELARGAALLETARCPYTATLANFAPSEDVSWLREQLGGQVAAAPYVPSVWSCPQACGAYDELLLPRLRQLCPTQPEQTAEEPAL